MAPASKTSRSRFSSPLHLSNSPAGHVKGPEANGSRNFMQRWLEPPVQNKASFQEAGLLRTGVLENMAPLGSLPKAQKKVEGNAASTVKKIVLKKSAARDDDSVMHTPAGESAEATGGDPPFPSPTRPFFPANGLDDEGDEDYMPKKKARSRRSSHSANNNNHSTMGRPSRGARRSSARPKTPMAASPQPSPEQPERSLTFVAPVAALREPEDKELVDKVVEMAVDEALDHYRYPTAWALRTLYDENSHDPHFVSMVEDIFHQRADIDTLQEFNRLVAEKKRDGKKDNKGCYYFVPPTTNSRFTPHKPKPAPYGDLLTMDATPAKGASVDGDGHVSKKAKLSLSGDHEAASPSIRNANGSRRGRSTTKSPEKKAARKTRSGSASSDSSLSSVPDEAIEDFEEYMDTAEDDVGGSRPSAAEPSNATQARPISSRQRKPATKKQIVSPGPGSELPPPPNTIRPASSSKPAMPGELVNGASHQHNHQTTGSGEDAAGYILPPSLRSDPFLVRKEAVKAATAETTGQQRLGSFSRNPLSDDSVEREDEVSAAPAATEQTRAARTPAEAPQSSRAARAAKRNHQDVDEASSPIAASSRTELELGSAQNSRAATPAAARSSKKPKTGPRVKTSPMKKKGTAAGIPRGGERPSPAANAGPSDKDENDDSCYTCGGNGELVCCDGCNYAFHFLCIDPPYADEGSMPDRWYCNLCERTMFPGRFKPHSGVFGTLLDKLDWKNPRAFSLPPAIREYFEGVKTGVDGEYEEAPAGKPRPTKKKDVEETIDWFKIRTADGEKAVLCHHCQKSATDNRPIVPCSVCGLHWHLECLDPPLTIPPNPRSWRCPCHADDVLAARLGPAHKHRKIKDAPVIEQSYSRGLKNNGFIEIEDDDDDDDHVPAGFEDVRDFGRVYRLPQKGIVLDFISRVKENKSAAGRPAVAPQTHGIAEQAAAVNMAALRARTSSADGISKLHEVMLSHASPEVISMMAQGDATRIAAGNLGDAESNALRAMMAEANALRDGIARILHAREVALAPPSRDNQATPATSVTGAGVPQSATPAIKDEGDQDTVRGMEMLTPDTTAEKGGDPDGDSAMHLD